ncbi:MAG TPA: hypothetical protein VGD89_05920 [Flavipsychrobacter sp.]
MKIYHLVSAAYMLCCFTACANDHKEQATTTKAETQHEADNIPPARANSIQFSRYKGNIKTVTFIKSEDAYRNDADEWVIKDTGMQYTNKYNPEGYIVFTEISYRGTSLGTSTIAYDENKNSIRTTTMAVSNSKGISRTYIIDDYTTIDSTFNIKDNREILESITKTEYIKHLGNSRTTTWEYENNKMTKTRTETSEYTIQGDTLFNTYSSADGKKHSYKMISLEKDKKGNPLKIIFLTDPSSAPTIHVLRYEYY